MLTQKQQSEDQSFARKYAKHQVKKQGKKTAKKLAKKGVKKLAIAGKAAVKKLSVLLLKLLGWIVGAVGLPVILIVIGIIILVIIISLSFSFFMGTGEGLEGNDKAIYEYIVKQSNATVDMNSSIERPYRVPEGLIAATIQIEAIQSKEDIKVIIRNIASSLAPTFDYGEYDEWKEKQVTVCEDGKCKTGDIKHTKNMVTKINHVDYWNGSTTFTYTKKVTEWKSKTVTTYKTIKVPAKKAEWIEIMAPARLVDPLKDSKYPYYYPNHPVYDELLKIEKNPTSNSYDTLVKVYVQKFVDVMVDKKIEVKTTTKTRHQYFTSTQQSITDYATFDGILNSYGLGLNDKKLIEANYLFIGGQIAYTEWLSTMGAGGDFSGMPYFDGTIIPGAGVPPQYMPFYRAAEKKYGVSWNVLAAIHFVETGFSTHPTMISSVGAVGHVQFMPATWVGWKYNIGGGLVSPALDITSLTVIASGRGYGVDGNGDGKADPWNLEDSIHTAANYLSASGFKSDPRKAIWAYNHADWYVNKVLTNAEKFKTSATYEGGGATPPLKPGSFMRPTLGPISSPFGVRSGGMHYGIDIASGGKSNVPIVAAADGIVTRSAFSSSYGNVVYIKHNINGQTWETVYAHMVNRAVANGAQVKQGQFLGYMGTTGDSTGVHLHFEVHLNGWTKNKANARNPALLVPF
ncbi:peptidase M23 [Fictibacillus phosphorivorans]|uniref:Peptidase M23 n=1 Tax=Fictibacillus phosphorivorans TaxID=1221500 RepID=A0A163S2G3_9BACL|nr:peptidoglycan DD-metalloendopeptidase family protein [Fictibacillus phosphorivorans]KZE68004.1 peptidase M23 [Fictibacillus phosphorivorans]